MGVRCLNHYNFSLYILLYKIRATESGGGPNSQPPKWKVSARCQSASFPCCLLKIISYLLHFTTTLSLPIDFVLFSETLSGSKYCSFGSILARTGVYTNN